MRHLFHILSLSLVLIIFSCEEQPVVIPMGGGGPGDTTQTVQKVVLIEELTGVSCPNCPAGTAALEAILTVFGDKVVSNAIHGSFLAQPNSLSQYDFRNDDAADLENFLAPFLGKPAAVIDRVHFDGEDFMTVDNIGRWQSLVSQRLQEPATVMLEISSDYNETSRTASITVECTGLEEIEGNIKLSVVVNESHIMDSQSDQTEIIPVYEHNHVMRDMLTAVQGDIISTMGIEEGETISRTYTYTVPDEVNGEWIADNMEVVAYVVASMRDNEVQQAAATHLN